MYIDLFTKKPILTINAVNMNIGFNPNNLFDLGDLGTVYPTAEVKDAWGAVEVTENGMLMKDWQVIYLPVDEKSEVNGTNIHGNGWDLALRPGWKIENDGRHNYKIVKHD